MARGADHAVQRGVLTKGHGRAAAAMQLSVGWGERGGAG